MLLDFFLRARLPIPVLDFLPHIGHSQVGLVEAVGR